MQIRQFDEGMVAKAESVGRVLAGVLARVWVEKGAEVAIRQIEDADQADPEIAIRWIWLDETHRKFGERQSELWASDWSDNKRVVTFIAFDEKRSKLRYTFIPVSIPGERRGALEITQSLSPLAEFTKKTLIRSLVISAMLALASGTIIYFLIYSKIRLPLEKLSRKALEIGKGNLNADLEIKGDDELMHLAKIMNDMCTRLFIAQEKIHFENLARLKTLEQLRHTEKLSTVGQIAAGIAHEIGTPLNVVDGRAKMIISEPLEREEIMNCAKIIKSQAERMTLIIRQLLDFSRKKKVVHKVRENVITLIRQVFHLLTPLATKQGVGLLLKIAPEVKAHCFVDSQQIQQVFMNIIMNAIQATPCSGSVHVDVANILLKSMIHTDDQLRELLRIDIRDEGEGIPEENLSEIFTPFFTTKSVGLGTGLGLSIAREMLEENSGWIEVRNRPTKGAEFSLYFKLEESGQ
ncbi:MAG: HAMP domain-containing protein [Proteobacteria bacterium]|nr:HAMP domain-containing protein [Pseudomonadota bacterium]